MPGELGDHGGGDARVGPLQFLAPVLAHRQRHHHVAQQHRHVHRGVGHQREPERDQRVGVDVQGNRQVALQAVAEDPVAEHHREHRGVQRHHLAGPVHQHVPVPGRQVRRPGVALPGPARAEPLPPDPAEGLVAGHRRVRAEALPDVLADHGLLGAHAHLRPAQRLLADREDRLPDLLGDRRVPAALAQPAVIGAADQPEPPPPVLPPDQRVVADGIQAQQPGLLPVHGLQLRHLRPAAGGQRRGVRVVLRPGLARPGPQPVPAAEARRDLQQVRHPQPGKLAPARPQVLRRLGLTAQAARGGLRLR